MDLYRLTIQDSQDSMQFDLLDAPIKIEDVEGAVDNTVLTGDIFTDYLFLKKRWEQKWAIMCKDEYERLRGFYTRQWSLATVPSVKVTQGYLENTSWEGQIFYINTPYGGEIDSMSRMTGDTYQQTYSGKNLFDIAELSNAFIRQGGGSNAVQIDLTDEVLKLTSLYSQTNNYVGIPLHNSVALLGETVEMSATAKLGGTSSAKIALYWASNTNVLSLIGSVATTSQDGVVSGSVSIPSSFPSGATQIVFVLYASATAEVIGTYNEYSNIQLEKGSSVTDYEPYVGGVPSPNPQYPQAIRTVTGEQTISINGTDFKINLGKNLFDKDTAGIINGYVNASGSIVAGQSTRCVYMRCSPNTTYTVQKTNAGTNQRFCVFTATEEPAVGKTILSSVGTRGGPDTHDSYTITTEPNANWLGIFIMASSTTPTQAEIMATIQVEEGGEKTDYAPYFAPYRLANIDSAQDSIYFNGSDWLYHQEVGTDTRDIQVNGISGNASSDSTVSAKGAFSVLKSALGWTSDYDTTLGVAKISSNLGRYKLDTSVIGNATAENMQDGTFCQRQGTNDRCYFRATSLIGKTGVEVKAILANQGGVNAWWALATPTETAITDATLISQLNAIQAALQEGQNTVAVTANGSNLPAKTITLNGIAGREKPVLAQTNVRIGLSDGGVLNACECRQNVTLTMRETA